MAKVVTLNTTAYPVYIRIKKTYKEEDWGPCDANSRRTWTSGKYKSGDRVKVYAEIKHPQTGALIEELHVKTSIGQDSFSQVTLYTNGNNVYQLGVGFMCNNVG